MSKKLLSELRNELYVLINDEAHRELECRKFLYHVSEDLCGERPNSIVKVGKEEPSRFGLSDFVISADITHGGISERIAYVWDLKAPRLYLYELDNNIRRFRPTKDLVSAETQLIHYVSELGDSAAFRTYFDLRANSRVVPAGIIIGRNDRLARVSRQRPEDKTVEQVAHAEYSHLLRNHLVYGPAGIRVKTWSRVLRLLDPTSGAALFRGSMLGR